jgi:hypothetical protein
MGRGIEYNPKTKSFRPTNIVEIQNNGHHPGIIQRAGINSTNPSIFLTGSAWTVEATALLYNYSPKPKYLFYCAGQPLYLKELIKKYSLKTNLTEGEILQCEFKKLAPNHKLKEKIAKHNKYSIDDIRWVLNKAKIYKLNSLLFITIDPHTKRLRVFINKLKGDLKINVKTTIVDSFSLVNLLTKSQKKKNVIKNIKSTFAYKRTLASELRGTKDFLNNTYQSVQHFKHPKHLQKLKESIDKKL